ncbi:protein kinase [Skermania piniformis]
MAEPTRMEPGDDRPRIDYTKRNRAPKTSLDADRTPLSGPAPATSIEGSIPSPAPASSPEDFHRKNLPPTLVDRGYRMRRLLGGGAEASVWLCTDAVGNELAVKLYRHAPRYRIGFDSTKYRQHFTIDCAVQVYERGEDHGFHYEVMEYCRPGTLADLAGRHGDAVSDELAGRIVGRLAAAVRGVQGTPPRLVHGDIKPANILVRRESPLDLVLADFGLTVDLGQRSSLSNFGQGTTAYNAPELLRSKGPAADWWSVGMVLYTLLVGRAYFQRDDGTWMDDDLIEREHISREVSLEAIDRLAFPADRRKRWRLLLTGLLTRNPDDRWGAGQVAEWTAGRTPPVARPAVAQPAGPGQPPRPPVTFAVPGVGEFDDPTELGRAMAAHPTETARALAGRGAKKLITWLTDEVKTGVGYSDFRTHRNHWGPDEQATYFIAQLAPDESLSYRGCLLTTPADLRNLAHAADPATIDALLRAELIGAIADSSGRAKYRMIDATWHDLTARTTELADQRAIPMSDVIRIQIIRRALLLAAGDETMSSHYVRDVRERLGRPENTIARQTNWFAQLCTDAEL